MKTEKVMLVINEQHELLPSQREQLGYNFPESEVEKVLVPAEGWTIEEMERILSERLWGNFVVFVSPIPYLIKKLSFCEGLGVGGQKGYTTKTFLFHNDRREKKELPNGKVISVLAKEGWQIV